MLESVRLLPLAGKIENRILFNGVGLKIIIIQWDEAVLVQEMLD